MASNLFQCQCCPGCDYLPLYASHSGVAVVGVEGAPAVGIQFEILTFAGLDVSLATVWPSLPILVLAKQFPALGIQVPVVGGSFQMQLDFGSVCGMEIQPVPWPYSTEMLRLFEYGGRVISAADESGEYAFVEQIAIGDQTMEFLGHLTSNADASIQFTAGTVGGTGTMWIETCATGQFVNGEQEHVISLCRTAGSAPFLPSSHLSVQLPPQRDPRALAGHTNVPGVAVTGQKVTIYRTGYDAELNAGTEIVLAAVWPSAEASVLSTLQDGSYFVVQEVDQESDPLEVVSGDTPRAYALLQKDFASFVVDTRPPMVGYVPEDDRYMRSNGIPTSLLNMGFDIPRVYGTEPLYFERGSVANPSQGAPYQYQSDIGSLPVSPGYYEIIPFTSATIWDAAGNQPLTGGSYAWRCHARPVGGPIGPVAMIRPEGEPLTVYRQPSARDLANPVSRLVVRFDKPVDPETVNTSQLRLFVNGVQVTDGISVSQDGTDGRRYVFQIPTAPQVSRAWCFVEYDPSGIVESDDEARTPSVLVARTAWLMRDAILHYELVNTSKRSTRLGLVSSVHELENKDGYTTPSLALATSGNVTASRFDGGSFTQPQYPVGRFTAPKRVGFVPGVPAGDAAPDCSWWGLRTSIDPCPPMVFPECKAPRGPQRHASLIRTEEDILGLNVGVQLYFPGVPSEVLVFDDAFSLSGVGISQNWWRSVSSSRVAYAMATRAAAEFVGLGTATLGELQVYITLLLEQTFTVPGLFGDEPFSHHIAGLHLTLTKEQEAALAGGDVVTPFINNTYSETNWTLAQNWIYDIQSAPIAIIPTPGQLAFTNRGGRIACTLQRA